MSLRFSCVTPRLERFFLDLPRAVKKWRMCFGSGKWDVLKSGILEFVIAG